MCVGESLDEREAGLTEEKVLGQLRAGTSRLDPEAVADMVIAYEPIWAIGTGRTATPDDAQAVCGAIRAAVAADQGATVGEKLRVQYGGSVTSQGIAALMAQHDIDGALVGGASLDPVEFAKIIAFDRP